MTPVGRALRGFAWAALSGAAAGGTAATARAEETDLYKISLPNFPKFYGSCPLSAAAVAARFKAVTGLEAVRTECHEHRIVPANAGHDPVVDYDLSVFYAASHRLRSVQLGDYSDPENRGSYGSKDACEADRARQTALFTTATGLKAAWAYCFSNEWVSADNWGVYAVGFGTPLRTVFLSTLMIAGTYDVPEAPAILAGVQRGFASAGGVVANAFMRWTNVGSFTTLNVRYYAPQAISLYDWSISADDAQTCSAQRRAVLGMLEAAAFEPTAAFCTPRIGDYFDTHILSMAATWPFTDDSLPFSYDSYAACTQDLAHAMHSYSPLPGYSLRGAFCDGNAFTARIHTLLTPTGAT